MKLAKTKIITQTNASTFIRYSLETTAKAIRQEKTIKWIQKENEGIKMSLFENDMILCKRDPKDYISRLLCLTDTFSKVTECKTNI